MIISLLAFRSDRIDEDITGMKENGYGGNFYATYYRHDRDVRDFLEEPASDHSRIFAQFSQDIDDLPAVNGRNFSRLL